MIGAAPWAIQPAALDELLDRIARGPTIITAPAGSDLMRGALSGRPEQSYAGQGRARIRDGVAIMPVMGPIFRYSNFLTEAGIGTSLAAFATDLTAADADPKVRAILIEADSPGGEIAGLAGAADLVRTVAIRKPVVAYTGGLLASGAYQIAAAARQIVAAPTAIVGGLGTVLAVTDRRAADAAAGTRRHEFVSSQTPGKRPDPATQAGRTAIQALADSLAAEFLADVAHSRGTTIEALLAASGGGGLVIGRDAVARGLADRVGGYEETVSRLASGDAPAARKRGSSVAAPPKQKALSMTTVPSTPARVALAPPQDPVSRERARASAIHGLAAPGFLELAGLATASGWSPDVFKETQAALAGGAQLLASMPAVLSRDDQLAALWAGSAKTRAEFRGDRESFLAFQNAMASGSARLIAPRRQAAAR